MSCATAMIVMATILGPITLVFMAVSFGTDHWLRFDVDRTKLTNDDKLEEHNLYSHTRYRGLFRVCYPGNDTAFLESRTDTVDGFCLKVDYDMPDNTADKSDNYLVRIHLLRLFLAFYIIALVFFVAAFVFGLVLCCWRVSRWAYVAALLAYISAFSTAAAIAFFHGAEYMERNKLSDHGFYLQWPERIQSATSRSYEWSYALGWVAVILASITATFYAVAGCYIAASRYEDRERVEKEFHRGTGDYPLYAMEPARDPYVFKPQAVYPYAYPGPYLVPAPETPRYIIAEAPSREVWSIR